MPLSDHITMNIIASAVTATRVGFGLPLIISHKAPFAELVKLYSSYTDVLDDFASDDAEARCAAAMFSQSPAPNQIAIGRASSQVTHSYDVTFNLPTATIREPSILDVSVPATLWDSVLETREQGTYTNGTRISTVSGSELSLTETLGGGGLGHTTITYQTGVTTVAQVEALIDAESQIWQVRTAGTGGNTLTNPGDTITAEVSASGVDGIPYPVYTMEVGGFGMVDTEVSVTWAPGDTATSIASAMSTALNAVTNANYTSTPTTNTLAVVADNVNTWFFLSADPSFAKSTAEATNGLIKLWQDTAAPAGLATDLSDMNSENGSWFWLVSLFNSDAYISAVATWAGAQSLKFYMPDSNDTRDLETSTGSFGAMDDLKTLGFFRSGGVWNHKPQTFPGAALVGNLAQREVGSWTAKFKNLQGCTASKLTGTQRANLVARYANFYETVAGIDITSEGTTALGPSVIRGFIDDVVNLDWVQDDMEKGLFEALAGAPKIPRTDAGMVVLEEKMRATMQRATTRTVASEDPAPTVTIPTVASMSDLLPRGVRASFQFTLAGAAHSAVVNGNVYL